MFAASGFASPIFGRACFVARDELLEIGARRLAGRQSAAGERLSGFGAVDGYGRLTASWLDRQRENPPVDSPDRRIVDGQQLGEHNGCSAPADQRCALGGEFAIAVHCDPLS